MTPTTLPPATALALGERRARALRALRLLQHASTRHPALPEDRAVAHAVRILRGPKPPEPPRVWVGQRRDGHTEWLELPGVQSVRWEA